MNPQGGNQPVSSGRNWSFVTATFWIVVALLLGSGGPASSELVLSDPESEVYFRFAAAAGTEVKVDKNAEVEGNLHSNGNVDLKKESLVVGDVSAFGQVNW